jgi:cell division septal protein FtsQ
VSRPSNDLSPVADWRKLQQTARRAVPLEAVRRRRLQLMMRAGLGVVVALVCAALVLVGVYLWRTSPIPERSSLVTHQIVRVEFVTNGVLSRNWFTDRWSELLQRPALDIDIRALRAELEADGQIAEARVVMELPDTLRIHVKERQPLLRARFADPAGNPTTVLIAGDGVVYAGALYPQRTLASLPGLAGVRIRQAADGYLPLEGMAPVAELLELARAQVPDRVRQWAVIDLRDYRPASRTGNSQITVRERAGLEVVFADRQFAPQLARLQAVLAEAGRRGQGMPRRVDLSFNDEVVVQY